MSRAGQSAAAVLLTLAPLGLYVWTLFGLRAIFLRGAEELSPTNFAARFPERARLPAVHAAASLLVFLLALGAGFYLGRRWAAPPFSYGVGTLVFVAGLNAFNGAFELSTGVSAVYGVTTRRSYAQRFVTDAAVVRLGRARLLLSAALAAAACLLAAI